MVQAGSDKNPNLYFRIAEPASHTTLNANQVSRYHLRRAKGFGHPEMTRIHPRPRWQGAKRRYRAAPIRNTLVPQEGHVPDVAGLPFFIVMAWGFRISLLDLHFTQ